MEICWSTVPTRTFLDEGHWQCLLGVILTENLGDITLIQRTWNLEGSSCQRTKLYKFLFDLFTFIFNVWLWVCPNASCALSIRITLIWKAVRSSRSAVTSRQGRRQGWCVTSSMKDRWHREMHSHCLEQRRVNLTCEKVDMQFRFYAAKDWSCRETIYYYVADRGAINLPMMALVNHSDTAALIAASR